MSDPIQDNGATADELLGVGIQPISEVRALSNL